MHYQTNLQRRQHSIVRVMLHKKAKEFPLYAKVRKKLLKTICSYRNFSLYAESKSGVKHFRKTQQNNVHQKYLTTS